MIGALNSVNVSTPNYVGTSKASGIYNKSKADSVSFQGKMLDAGTFVTVREKAYKFVKNLGDDAYSAFLDFQKEHTVKNEIGYKGFKGLFKQFVKPVHAATNILKIYVARDADTTQRLVIRSQRNLAGRLIDAKPVSVEIPGQITKESFTEALNAAKAKADAKLELNYQKVILNEPSYTVYPTNQ